jgi:hypothetical protein
MKMSTAYNEFSPILPNSVGSPTGPTLEKHAIIDIIDRVREKVPDYISSNGLLHLDILKWHQPITAALIFS